MLPAKYIGFIIFVWVTGSILGGILEYAQLGGAEEAVINPLMSWQEYTSEEDWGILKLVAFLPTFFRSVFDMLLFNFSFLTGSWVLVKWILLAPIIGTVVYGIAITFAGILRRAV